MKRKREKMSESENKKKGERVFMKPGKTNKEDRLNFIEFWASYIRTHSDKEWSKQQNVLIDSVIKRTVSLVKKK